MSRNPDTLNNLEIADQMTARGQELRCLATRIHELEELVPVGSQLRRGIALVERDVQGAGQNLERLCTGARTMIV
ncbi:MAG: hypothetical protein HY674_15860 [Chloroflexi bacterium]|nr:hypothetical protein [Chloroflexota bacterium]